MGLLIIIFNKFIDNKNPIQNYHLSICNIKIGKIYFVY